MRLALFLALAIAFGATETATAQTLVAGSSPGPTLTVVDKTERTEQLMELNLHVPNAADPSDPFDNLESGNPPLWADEAILASEGGVESEDGPRRVVVAGAVNAAAASVEIGFDDAQTVRIPTIAGEAYTGRYAGRVRFFLGEAMVAKDTEDNPRTLRMLDGNGAVIGVGIGPDSNRKARVLRRRVGGRLVRIYANLSSSLQPLPGAPEHRSEELCLHVAVPSVGEEPQVACQEPDEPLELGGRRGCGRTPTTLAGFVPAETERLAVHLGSGRSFMLTARAAPFGRAGRIVAGFVPRDEAIRTASAIDASGRVLARGRPEVAPPNRRCDTDFRFDNWRFYGDFEPRLGTPPGTEVAGAVGGTRLLVRDSGELLCAGLDQLDLDGADCTPPPYKASYSWLYVDLKRGFVAGIYPARITALDILYRDGGRARIPATEGTGYTGRYRADVHFALAATPVGRTVVGAELLDASGFVIGGATAEGPGADQELIGRPSTVLRAGFARLAVGARADPVYGGKNPCVGLALGDERSDCRDDQGQVDSNSINARVPCDRRRTILFGTARHDVKRVEIRLSGGRRINAELAAFPRGLGARSKIYLAVIPRRVAATEVRFVGGAPNDDDRTSLELPGRSAARQCGYALQTYL